MMKKKILALGLVTSLAATAVVGGTLAYFTDTKEVENTFVMGNVKIKLDEQDITKTDGSRTEEGNKYEETLMPGTSFVKDPTITNIGSEDAYLFLDMTMNKYKSMFPVMALDAVEQKIGGYTQDMFNACVTASDNGTFSSQAFLNQMAANKEMFQAIVNRWFVGIAHDDWQLCDVYYNCDEADVTVKGNYLTFRFAYIGDDDGTVATEKNDKATFMTGFKMPETVTQEMVEENYVNSDFNTENGAFKLNFKAYGIQAAELDTVADAYKAMFNTGLDDLSITVHK